MKEQSTSCHQVLRRSSGFTLLELCVVVGIVGVLAALAIPNYYQLTYRAKRSELPANLEAIRTAEKAYHAEYNKFLAVASSYGIPLGTQVSFGSIAGDGSGWDYLGWIPDGRVRGYYEVKTGSGEIPVMVNRKADDSESATSSCAWLDSSSEISSSDFWATAISDLDRDNDCAQYDATRDRSPTLVSANSSF